MAEYERKVKAEKDAILAKEKKEKEAKLLKELEAQKKQTGFEFSQISSPLSRVRPHFPFLSHY